MVGWGTLESSLKQIETGVPLVTVRTDRDGPLSSDPVTQGSRSPVSRVSLDLVLRTGPETVCLSNR